MVQFFVLVPPGAFLPPEKKHFRQKYPFSIAKALRVSKQQQTETTFYTNIPALKIRYYMFVLCVHHFWMGLSQFLNSARFVLFSGCFFCY